MLRLKNMGVTKTELFTETQNELSQLAKALGHPARIAIIEYLVQAETCVNSHLVDELGLAQATISQHLKALKETGIIQGSIDGTSINYCINTDQWERIANLFDGFFTSYLSKNECC